MMKWALSLVAALSSACLASQAAVDQSAANNGVLAARILVTDDIEGFWKAWEGPTPPMIQTAKQITRKRPVYATMVFAGCKAAPDGNCRIKASFTIVSPDGSIYGQHGPMDGWSGPPAPGRNMLVVEGYLGFELEPEDKLGRYVIKGELKDDVAKTSLSVQTEVVAKADNPS